MSAVLPEMPPQPALADALDALDKAKHAAADVPTVLPTALPLTPIQRLELSRAQLRHALFPPAPPVKASPGIFDGMLASLKTIPGIDLAFDVVQGWWYRHPLKPMSEMAGEASKAALRPVAQRHPFALMLAAVGVGVLIASFRPWRWALRSALFAGLLPQMLSRMVTKLPIESWLSVLGNLVSAHSSPPVSPSPHEADAPNRPHNVAI